MEQNLVELKAAGIKNVPKFLLGLNQSANGKVNDKEEVDIGRAVNGDEDFVPSDDSTKKACSSAQPLRKSQRNQEQGGSTQEATQAEQLPTSPTEQPDMFCSPRTVVGCVETPAIPSRTPQNLKRKRGPTKLKTIAIDGSSRIEVKFDENGEPIGEGSVKLSSFLGPLVREIVPYTLSDWRKLPSGMTKILWQSIKVRFNLHEEWHRQMVFRRMNEDWRASKSILVKKIRNASNKEERLKLQPDNVKSLHDWKDFVKEKTSKEFKKAKKDVASISRAVVWADGHRDKNGKPKNKNVAQKIEDMGKIERNGQNSSNLKEDAVSKVLGAERNGRVRTFGKGVTLTRLTILSQMNGQFAELCKENAQMKSQMSDMRNTVDEFKKSQVQNLATTEATPTIPLVSPSDDMEKIENDTPSLPSNNLKEDALSN
ncbi:hypothetical protein RHSIM_Rhsim01G0043800 [Rhododendron simsii]|uniref:Transposase n=1 Tax=Rhododendron simsii TaxID=118357 RepID=A0A834HM42_RHOSS|nr:hypothetical protein RHSIM_Rhsim01G0043800 [Rhododendron simsii]